MTAPLNGSDNDQTRFWDRTARRYASSHIKDIDGYERTMARTGQLIGGMQAVLEIGCGTGMTALRLAPKVGRVLATDISPRMIAIARERTQDAGSDVTFHVCAADELPVPDVGFDAILAFNLLHLVENRTMVLKRAFQRLKPGGLFISKTPCLSEMNLALRFAVPVMRVIGLAPHVAFFKSVELEREIAAVGFAVEEQGYHGSSHKDARTFIVAQKPGGNRQI